MNSIEREVAANASREASQDRGVPLPERINRGVEFVRGPSRGRDRGWLDVALHRSTVQHTDTETLPADLTTAPSTLLYSHLLHSTTCHLLLYTLATFTASALQRPILITDEKYIKVGHLIFVFFSVDKIIFW